ncbi:NYN domain-containing protein [Thermococcus sp.]|uniref:NYN domain-containing protein n=1 Tax=Thermococcus sp. TaxID=35749 RepID=UPI002631775A|nr:NYN domain-containing protein [Thermococcus sp.]MCD6144195.1 NYN domain-containing protein [Thermococcus sp.]
MSNKERSIGLLVNGPNVLIKKFSVNLQDISNALKSLGRIVIGKVILNHNAPQKLVEAVINHGLEPVIVNGRADVAFTVEAMKLIYNSRVNALALAVRDAHFLPILFEAKKAGKEVIIVGPREDLSEALQNAADKVIKL